jgi:hypothetical protein
MTFRNTAEGSADTAKREKERLQEEGVTCVMWPLLSKTAPLWKGGKQRRGRERHTKAHTLY